MSSLISIFNTFQDLKLKSSGGGGLSDGGIICRSQTLSTSSPVVIEPPKGVNWGGSLAPYGISALLPGGVILLNFDATAEAFWEEYMVLEDGSEVFLETGSVVAGAHSGIGVYFQNGGVLNNPNKLKYKLVQNGTMPLPTKRILLKYALVEYDQTPQ
jgi:hypothetical protein